MNDPQTRLPLQALPPARPARHSPEAQPTILKFGKLKRSSMMILTPFPLLIGIVILFMDELFQADTFWYWLESCL
jgi:hypothetical protein